MKMFFFLLPCLISAATKFDDDIVIVVKEKYNDNVIRSINPYEKGEPDYSSQNINSIHFAGLYNIHLNRAERVFQAAWYKLSLRLDDRAATLCNGTQEPNVKVLEDVYDNAPYVALTDVDIKRLEYDNPMEWIKLLQSEEVSSAWHFKLYRHPQRGNVPTDLTDDCWKYVNKENGIPSNWTSRERLGKSFQLAQSAGDGVVIECRTLECAERIKKSHEDAGHAIDKGEGPLVVIIQSPSPQKFPVAPDRWVNDPFLVIVRLTQVLKNSLNKDSWYSITTVSEFLDKYGLNEGDVIKPPVPSQINEEDGDGEAPEIDQASEFIRAARLEIPDYDINKTRSYVKYFKVAKEAVALIEEGDEVKMVSPDKSLSIFIDNDNKYDDPIYKDGRLWSVQFFKSHKNCYLSHKYLSELYKKATNPSEQESFQVELGTPKKVRLTHYAVAPPSKRGGNNLPVITSFCSVAVEHMNFFGSPRFKKKTNTFRLYWEEDSNIELPLAVRSWKVPNIDESIPTGDEIINNPILCRLLNLQGTKFVSVQKESGDFTNEEVKAFKVAMDGSNKTVTVWHFKGLAKQGMAHNLFTRALATNRRASMLNVLVENEVEGFVVAVVGVKEASEKLFRELIEYKIPSMDIFKEEQHLKEAKEAALSHICTVELMKLNYYFYTWTVGLIKSDLMFTSMETLILEKNLFDNILFDGEGNPYLKQLQDVDTMKPFTNREKYATLIGKEIDEDMQIMALPQGDYDFHDYMDRDFVSTVYSAEIREAVEDLLKICSIKYRWQMDILLDSLAESFKDGEEYTEASYELFAAFSSLLFQSKFVTLKSKCQEIRDIFDPKHVFLPEVHSKFVLGKYAIELILHYFDNADVGNEIRRVGQEKGLPSEIIEEMLSTKVVAVDYLTKCLMKRTLLPEAVNKKLKAFVDANMKTRKEAKFVRRPKPSNAQVCLSTLTLA